MDKFGHEPLHYPDEVQPDKHKHERSAKDETAKRERRVRITKHQQPNHGR